MSSMINKILGVVSVIIFGVAGYVFWLSTDISEKLQTTTSKIRIYSAAEPDYSVFVQDFDDKAKFGSFNSGIAKLVKKVHVNNVDFRPLGKYKDVTYSQALYTLEAEEDYLQFIKFIGYIGDSDMVHRINDLSIESNDAGKLVVSVKFEVLGYGKNS